MNKNPMRAGANPAQTAPQQAQTSTRTEAMIAAVTAQLAESLKRSTRLLDRCEELADGPAPQSAPAIHAAARLLHGQIAAAAALAHVAQGESRHRTIVEYANGKETAERLNSNFSDDPPPLGNGKTHPGAVNGKSPQ